MTAAVLEARGLSAGYSGVPAVDGVDIEVGAGEVVALLGANGAGKTTTILTLCGELPPLGGDVYWLGTRTRSSLTRRAREGLALITEEKSVFMGLSVAENLRLGRGGAEHALSLFPELTDHLRRRAGLLSGGQQQMLAVARALASAPKALLADELSLGLAPMLARRLLVSVRDAARGDGVGVLLVEQHIREALRIADRVYVMQRGRVVLEGPASDIANRVQEVEQTYLSGVDARDSSGSGR